ncbi:MAG TPA: class I SAM-dependent RNA methyltransferase [Chthoniobacterales bacterium]
MRVVDLAIEDIAFGGKGVGRDEGKAVFIPFTVDGERVRARIVREKKQFAEAELVDVIEPSTHRVTPSCPYFGRCGGCAYQHIDYEHQLTIKSRQVRDILQRIGKINDPPIRSLIPSAKQYAYRNRITVHVEEGVIGFFARDSHHLIDIERCPISCDEINRALAELRAQKPRNGHYTLRTASTRRVFAQVNDQVADALRDLIRDLIPANQRLLIDAYCGAGFFAKSLLDKFERIIGIDWDKFAIAAARKTGSDKETYIAADVEAELTNLPALSSQVAESGGVGVTIIVDPPATGLSASARSAIINLAPDRFFYISCNPATLARDLKELCVNFMIESITPFDMFPQTTEIEVAVHLRSAAR